MSFQRQREQLVENELRNLGIHDEAVLKAMLTVPREEFVSDEMRDVAYENSALPIGSGQTISQPLIVAEMIESLKLKPTDRVLEIGTGSGYGAAVLSQIAQDVLTVERHEELADQARARFNRLGYHNVHVLTGDGTGGWPDEAPFDAIVVTAGAPIIPPALLQQIRIGGRIVIPVGEAKGSQKLLRVTRRDHDKFEFDDLGAVRFVPLIGAAGWPANEKSKGLAFRVPPPSPGRDDSD